MTDILTFVLLGLAAGGGAYLGSYLREKGRNTATREDIADITREVEKVRMQSTTAVELLRQEHRKGLIAFERRLDAHQEAYVHWNTIVQRLDAGTVGPYVLECREWLTRNCFSLDIEARIALRDACERAENHSAIAAKGDRDAVRENYLAIAQVGEIIEGAVELPAIADPVSLVSMGEAEPQFIPTGASATAVERGEHHE